MTSWVVLTEPVIEAVYWEIDQATFRFAGISVGPEQVWSTSGEERYMGIVHGNTIHDALVSHITEEIDD